TRSALMPKEFCGRAMLPIVPAALILLLASFVPTQRMSRSGERDEAASRASVAAMAATRSSCIVAIRGMNKWASAVFDPLLFSQAMRSDADVGYVKSANRK